MTRMIRAWFRPLLIVLAAGGAMVALAGAASASTTAPKYGHDQRCDETLVYQDSGYGDHHHHGGDFVVVRDVCHVRIHGYSREDEVVTYDQREYRHLEHHIVFGVSDAEVFGGYGYY